MSTIVSSPPRHRTGSKARPRAWTHHVMSDTASTGTTDNIDGGQRLVGVR